MSKRKRPKTESQKLYEKNVQIPQSFEIPKEENGKSFSRFYTYMIMHPNYLSLSGNAVKIYTLMRAKIWEDINKYAKDKTFEFSANKIEAKGIMVKKTCIKALRELEHYGFIRKENNATFQSGITQRWSFSDEWSKRIYPKFKD